MTLHLDSLARQHTASSKIIELRLLCACPTGTRQVSYWVNQGCVPVREESHLSIIMAVYIRLFCIPGIFIVAVYQPQL